MKAMVYTREGGLDVLQIRELPKPSPTSRQVLIAVKAGALNVTDCERFKTLSDKVPLSMRLMNRALGFVGKPIGAEISGIVVETGAEVAHVKVGDQVFGKVAGFAPAGGFAEYALMDRERVNAKPSNLSFEQAAAVSISFETALAATRRAKVASGQDVLIYGASGGVGLYAVSLARAAGAKVVGVCSTRNIEIAKKAGCDSVIDYKTEDYTKCGLKFDAILGINGQNPMRDYQKLLKPDGVFVGVGNARQAFGALLKSLTSKHFSVIMGPKDKQPDYLSYAKELAESGNLVPYVDRVYPVAEAADAIRYLLTAHAQGKVVLRMSF